MMMMGVYVGWIKSSSSSPDFVKTQENIMEAEKNLMGSGWGSETEKKKGAC